MTVMTDDRNPTTFNRSQWQRLSARLILAHLDDDPDMRSFYIDLVRHESGCSPDAFTFANSTAEMFARGYPAPSAREWARAKLTEYLEEM